MNTQQGTPAWFNARKGKLTASNFGSAAGINPYTSRAKALRLELGKEKWSGNMDACAWGTKNERNAIKDYMVRTGNVVNSKGFFPHPEYDWLGGSPDGLVGNEGLIEVKCPFINKICHGKIPPIYYCQVNGLLEILNREWCDFISWTPTETTAASPPTGGRSARATARRSRPRRFRPARHRRRRPALRRRCRRRPSPRRRRPRRRRPCPRRHHHLRRQRT